MLARKAVLIAGDSGAGGLDAGQLVNDLALANRMFSQAASAGVAQAIVNVAGAKPPNEQMPLWRVAAAQGESSALLNIAISHRDGLHGMPRDDVAAAFFFRRSAERGCVQA